MEIDTSSVGELSVGELLRRIHSVFGLALTDIENLVRGVAAAGNNQSCYLSLARLAGIERGDVVPTPQEVACIFAACKWAASGMLAFAGEKDSSETVQTARGELELPGGLANLRPVPSAFATTALLPTVNSYEKTDAGGRKEGLLYGVVGADDFTMSPLIRPSSVLVIDPGSTKVELRQWRREHERPVYFIRLRDGFAVSWCELDGERILLIPHPLSSCKPRSFAFPGDVEIVGTVRAILTRLG